MSNQKDEIKKENGESLSQTENPFSQVAEAEEIVLEEEAKNTEEDKQKSEKEIKEDLKLKKEFDSLKAQYVRLAADFDNYRKRQAQEREYLLKYGAESTVKNLLPVLDTLERAEKSISQIDDPEKLKENFQVVKKQILDSLEKVGLEKIETQGKEFDPNLHEAVKQTPTNDQPDHTVINELQSGYKLGEIIIRPALVDVAVSE